MDNAEVSIRNKIQALYLELNSYDTQNTLIADMVMNYRTLVEAEERKFGFGESSLFLVNSREGKLLEAELKLNLLENKFFTAKAKLFNSFAAIPGGLQ